MTAAIPDKITKALKDFPWRPENVVCMCDEIPLIQMLLTWSAPPTNDTQLQLSEHTVITDGTQRVVGPQPGAIPGANLKIVKITNATFAITLVRSGGAPSPATSVVYLWSDCDIERVKDAIRIAES